MLNRLLKHFTVIYYRAHSQLCALATCQSVEKKSSRSNRNNLLLVLLLSFAALLTAKSANLFPKSMPAIGRNDIDLSGEWKISFNDKSQNASPNLNDSSWCLVGVPDPNLRKSKPREGCFSELYPVEQMRSNSYWYRKEIHIPEDQNWETPSLFLGAIKHRAWIYWDGRLAAISDRGIGTGITVVLLDQDEVRPGRHTLSIRVSSLNTRFPGIFHAYPRKVTLGDAQGNASQHERFVKEAYIAPTISIFIQLSGLALTLFLLVLGKGSTQNFFWLVTYFFGTTVGSVSHMAPPEAVQSLSKIGLILTSFSVVGYGLKFHEWTRQQTSVFNGITLGLMIFFTAAYSALSYFNLELGRQASTIQIAVAILPFTLFFASIVHSSMAKLSGQITTRHSRIGIVTIFILGFLHALNVANELLLNNVPIIADSFAIKCLLTVALAATIIYQHIEQERALAFYGRFIRPGLKSLLKEQVPNSFLGEIKLFRPRKIAIMKVDIVGHTESTFQMPYGLKRLFQDTWFTQIDRVVSEKVFLDKNVGDGSIYCFSEDNVVGTCATALAAAQKIRDSAISQFDFVLKTRFRELLEVTRDLDAPASSFFEEYRKRTGQDFWDRKTRVRISLVYGYVDEGLWGLTSQSHYDVQGDLVSLAARIESKACENEILMSEEFVNNLPSKTVKLLPRRESLKGIGEITVYSLKASLELAESA